MEQPQQFQQSNTPPQKKYVISIGAAIILGISGIIIAAIIAGAIVASSGVKTLRDFDFENFEGFEAQVNEQEGNTTVNVDVKKTETQVQQVDPQENIEPKVNNTDKYNRFVGEGCQIYSGCNGPIECDEAGLNDYNTNCEWKEEYMCYRESTARCEKQNSGSCGWTDTPELTSCIQSFN